jgi:Cdc6-like AAA superfamily ATPase
LEQWKHGRRYIWLNGIPGSGKTIICATVVDHFSEGLSHSVLYFFCNSNDASKQSVEKIVRSLIFQLYAKSADCQRELDRLFDSFTKEKQPLLSTLFTTFQGMVKNMESAL